MKDLVNFSRTFRLREVELDVAVPEYPTVETKGNVYTYSTIVMHGSLKRLAWIIIISALLHMHMHMHMHIHIHMHIHL
jgi:hypothetical protein